MMNKPLNLNVSWDTNLDPDLKVCSAAATYSRDTKSPCVFHGRLFFWSYNEARLWASRLPKFVGARAREFPAKRNNVWHGLGSIGVVINIAGTGGFSSENGIARYKRFIDTVIADGYKISWQCPTGVLRAYRDRAAFEAAFKPAPIRQYKDDSSYAEPD